MINLNGSVYTLLNWKENYLKNPVNPVRTQWTLASLQNDNVALDKQLSVS